MFCICFVEKKGNNSIRQDVLNKLKQNFTIFWVDNKYSFEEGNGQTIAVLNSKNFKELKTNKCLLIFDDNAGMNVPEITCENIVAVVNSSNSFLIKELGKIGVPVLTCGSSQKDTFTYSSFSENEIVVSLQRAIATLSGKIVEPFEIPVNHSEDSSIYSVLAYIAICTEFDYFEKNYL